MECQQLSNLVLESPLTEQMSFTLNVGVRRPLSNVNGSATRATALANSKPLSWYIIWIKSSIRRHICKRQFICGEDTQGEGSHVKNYTCASFPMESISVRTAALALGSAQSCLKSSYYILQRQFRK